MEITVTWFTSSKYPSFNVSLSSKEGADPFLDIKGCRIANGKNGEFVSWPSTKNESTGKYWNHVYASEKFAEAVLAKAKESAPSGNTKKAQPADDFDEALPF